MQRALVTVFYYSLHHHSLPRCQNQRKVNDELINWTVKWDNKRCRENKLLFTTTTLSSTIVRGVSTFPAFNCIFLRFLPTIAYVHCCSLCRSVGLGLLCSKFVNVTWKILLQDLVQQARVHSLPPPFAYLQFHWHETTITLECKLNWFKFYGILWLNAVSGEILALSVTLTYFTLWLYYLQEFPGNLHAQFFLDLIQMVITVNATVVL